MLIPTLLTNSLVSKIFDIHLTISITIILSLIVVVITVYFNFLKPEVNWIEYQRIAEELKKEKFHFLMNAGAYSKMDSEPERDKVFIERIKNIQLSEKSRWLNSINFTIKNETEWSYK